MGHGARSYRIVASRQTYLLGYDVGIANYILRFVEVGLNQTVTGAKQAIMTVLSPILGLGIANCSAEETSDRTMDVLSSVCLAVSAILGMVMLLIRVPLCFVAAGVGAAIGFAQNFGRKAISWVFH